MAFEDLAEQLRADHRNRVRFCPYAKDYGIHDLDAAYLAQASHVAAMQSEGLGEISGWKIGLTTRRMQELCGIDQPVAGAILSSRLYPSGTTIPAARYTHLIIEFEICLRLGVDLPPRDEPYDRAEIVAAVDGVAASAEIVDDRNCDYTTLDVPSLVADNAWAAGIVLGDFARFDPGLDLADCLGQLSLDTVPLATGLSREALGSPIEALLWLANLLSRRGIGLRVGDVVMTGSLVPPQLPEAPCHYSFDVAGLSTVALTVEP